MINEIKRKIKLGDLKSKIIIDTDSLIISVLCCVPMISFILNVNNIIVFSLLAILVFVILNKKKQILNNYKNNDFLLIYLLCLIILMIVNLLFFGFQNEGITRFLYFCVFGFLPYIILYFLYLCKINLNLIKIFRYINYFYAFFGLFIYNDNFWKYSFTERMPMSYYFLPLLLSVFFEFLLDKESFFKNKCVKIVLYIVLYYPYLRFTVGFMSRGTILAVFFCVLFSLLSLLKKRQKLIALLTIIIVSVIIVFFGLDILKFIQEFLNNFNVSFEFINKNIMLLEADSIGNGRGVIYQNAINGILQSPLIGNGIGSFEIAYGTYPHNFILQMLYEGGSFYMLLFCTPVFYSFCRVVYCQTIKKEYRFFFLFIFSLTFVRLSLSFEYWLDIFFWICLFISLILVKKDLKKYKIERKLKL